jgi:hypothetical protein
MKLVNVLCCYCHFPSFVKHLNFFAKSLFYAIILVLSNIFCKNPLYPWVMMGEVQHKVIIKNLEWMFLQIKRRSIKKFDENTLKMLKKWLMHLESEKNMKICKIWWKSVTTPLLEECEDDIHTPEKRTWESSRTPQTSKFDCRGQNTSPWGVLHVIGKLLKCKCRKWPCMSHLDICSISYGKRKGGESNLQFHSCPLKVNNWPDPGVCKWSAKHHWKALKESYKFALDLIPIGGLTNELWIHKVPKVQTGTILGFLLGMWGQKNVKFSI